jgi:hypothetical protein
MKRSTLHATLVLLLIGNICFVQHKDEETVRQLDNEERLAILGQDTLKLAVLMSPDIVVHNPENTIVHFRQIMDRIRLGYCIRHGQRDHQAYRNQHPCR